jgi:hypothetical protein
MFNIEQMPVPHLIGKAAPVVTLAPLRGAAAGQGALRVETVVQANFLLDLALQEEWVGAALNRSYEGHLAMR